jgi:hypothetical protein
MEVAVGAKFQCGVAFMANSLIYSNDLVEAATTAFTLLMGVLL